MFNRETFWALEENTFYDFMDFKDKAGLYFINEFKIFNLQILG